MYAQACTAGQLSTSTLRDRAPLTGVDRWLMAALMAAHPDLGVTSGSASGSAIAAMLAIPQVGLDASGFRKAWAACTPGPGKDRFRVLLALNESLGAAPHGYRPLPFTTPQRAALREALGTDKNLAAYGDYPRLLLGEDLLAMGDDELGRLLARAEATPFAGLLQPDVLALVTRLTERLKKPMSAEAWRRLDGCAAGWIAAAQAGMTAGIALDAPSHAALVATLQLAVRVRMAAGDGPGLVGMPLHALTLRVLRDATGRPGQPWPELGGGTEEGMAIMREACLAGLEWAVRFGEYRDVAAGLDYRVVSAPFDIYIADLSAGHGDAEAKRWLTARLETWIAACAAAVAEYEAAVKREDRPAFATARRKVSSVFDTGIDLLRFSRPDNNGCAAAWKRLDGAIALCTTSAQGIAMKIADRHGLGAKPVALQGNVPLDDLFKAYDAGQVAFPYVLTACMQREALADVRLYVAYRRATQIGSTLDSLALARMLAAHGQDDAYDAGYCEMLWHAPGPYVQQALVAAVEARGLTRFPASLLQRYQQMLPVHRRLVARMLAGSARPVDLDTVWNLLLAEADTETIELLGFAVLRAGSGEQERTVLATATRTVLAEHGDRRRQIKAALIQGGAAGDWAALRETIVLVP